MVATGVTMGLAEWIIDDTCLVILYFCYCKNGKQGLSLTATFATATTLKGNTVATLKSCCAMLLQSGQVFAFSIYRIFHKNRTFAKEEKAIGLGFVKAKCYFQISTQ